MRFKIDENLPTSLVQIFGERGHDVMTVEQQQINGGHHFAP